MQNFLGKKHTSFCLCLCHFTIREAFLLVTPYTLKRPELGFQVTEVIMSTATYKQFEPLHQLLLLKFGCHLSKRVNEVCSHKDFYFSLFVRKLFYHDMKVQLLETYHSHQHSSLFCNIKISSTILISEKLNL
jgi:hypothetical protein